ncbi:guanine nucleotide-binding protein alpha-3 subunit [Hesseltinella vesiculosa]|uniref:Guanine nucleotide-binding protein alpha-3 subunit n=1 Tax=Hesseltinella vesiculosa TaxID=101127 RepID=A0A1X2GLH2_9FUNG|nr:guanine nucleotide-binding protein alpha-3 subunit [Hesseltinella vesiculosa]
MGLCQSITRNNTTEGKLSREIDKDLEKERKQQTKHCKILLLGSGESGKSTILKQMKIINQNGFSQDELSSWRTIVFRNLYDSAQAIINSMQLFYYHYTGPDVEECVTKLQQEMDPNMTQLDTDVAKCLKLLWADDNVQQCLEERQSQFYIMDNATYFFENLDRIQQPDYIPTEQDVLRARLKSTGITEITFQLDRLTIHMFDVGGQRSERKKWIHCFESVMSIIFCVALSEYDQVLLEDGTENRMIESIRLFESIVNSRWFLHTSVMLFLNKVDIFKLKIEHVPLENYFPDYKGGSDANKAAKYVLWRFLQTNRAKLHIYPHLTQATDTTNIRFVFAAVNETILQNALRDSGML